MANTSLPFDLQKLVARHGYIYEDLNTIQVFRSKASFSKFANLALLLLGTFLLIGGLFSPIFFLFGFGVLLVPLVKYIQRKRFVFDFKKGTFEAKGSIFGGKNIYPFREISAIEVNYDVSDGDVSAFSNNQKQHNYRIYLRASNNREHELFFISEKEFNPIDSVAALRYTISNWIKPGS
jgi:hypothetical protein